MECGGKRSATPFWLRLANYKKPKRRRRCALPARLHIVPPLMPTGDSALASPSLVCKLKSMKTVPVIVSDEIQEDKPMPSRNHSRAAHNLGVLLDGFKDRYVIYDQLSLNLDGWQTIPDLCLFPRGQLPNDWLTDDDEVTQSPALVVEVLSPKQNLQPLVDKIREYGKHGVKSCWLVIPATHAISVFPATGGSRTVTEGVLRDETMGIEIPLDQVFA
ncbi:MAG: hypothetical protein C5B50_19195 [Verrucomicrobia bacterium]|nr:MAG: hypothetical protein C5B50_19195 [Verrucomicrobiota bacterium]